MIDDRKKRREEEVVAEVHADFLRRQDERRALERRWQLNLNFLNGNQYCGLNAVGELEDEERTYHWQERQTYNYVAPTYDIRCSKLSGIRPKLTVRAASEDDDDVRSAKLSSSILTAVCEDCDIDSAVTAATVWSEACGTAFYKVIWDGQAGGEIGATESGASLREGKVRIVAVSPFEIYPECLTEDDLYNQPSLIHARAVPAEDIRAAYGVDVKGRDVSGFELSHFSTGINASTVKHGYEVVIERYVRPNCDFPDGRLTIVAGDTLLFDGALPYINGEYGSRTYPFVRQQSLPQAGCFFGMSVIERLIPVQRAYNAVKNRKHEFLNRITMGTLAVEEGSVDVDDLSEYGLEPGRILVYRQGGTPPEMLTLGSVPAEFMQEEERLEEEFAKISGTTDLTQQANAFTSVTSATGLQLIIEQDDARLNVCYDQIKSAIKTIGKMVLRVYKQFATPARIMKFTTNGDLLTVDSFIRSDVTGDDVVLEADSDSNLTPARRRAAIYEMLDRGLFNDEKGEVPVSVRQNLLLTMGFNGAVGARDLRELHDKRCAEENEIMKKGGAAEVKEYDDHGAHVHGHTAYLLSEKLTKEQEARICEHLRQHKNKISEVKVNG